MERRSLEIGKSARGKGKPSLDSYTEPDQLNARQKEFCDHICEGIPPLTAGKLLEDPAAEQQVNRWMENEAIQKYIVQKGQAGVSDESQALYTALERVVLMDSIKKAKGGDVDLSIRRGMIERMQARLGLLPKKEAETEDEEKEPKSTMAKFVEGQEEKERKKK